MCRWRLQRFGFWLAVLIFYMVVTGGFVAGIRAGKASNTFPLTDGRLLPSESFTIEPWYLNFFNNMALVEFDHRLGAWLLALLVRWFAFRVQRALRARMRGARRSCWSSFVVPIALGSRRCSTGAGGPGRGAPGRSDAAVGPCLAVHELRVSPESERAVAPD